MENFIEISFTFLLAIVFFYFYFREVTGLPSNWPVVGMFPGLLVNILRIYEFFVEILTNSQLSFRFKGPWFANMDLLATADPANVHHVMVKNFGNYPKGSKFREIFDVLGDGIFSSDSHVWEYHRKVAQSFLGHPKFHQFLVNKVVEKLEGGLVPLLDHVCKQSIEIDLQDVFGRFTFDTLTTIITDVDPKSLSIELPSQPAVKALKDVGGAILYRHALPSWVWKFQRWLSIGHEKKHKQAWKVLDDYANKCIASKRSRLSKVSTMAEINEIGLDLLTLYMEENTKNGAVLDKAEDDKFMRDVTVGFLGAGTGTTVALTWFFYLLSKNQEVESKIRAEINKVMNDPLKDFSKNSREIFSKLVYLHAALCEALRLYPPIPFEGKCPAKPDVLPSGHEVRPGTQVIISMFAMGRMKSIWGDDCCEFKPERWITQEGRIKYEPSHKFFAFNAGPRTCVGKDVAFTQMKITAVNLIRNYRIEPVEGFPIVPEISVILHMKHGFKVKVVRL